jgi:HEAT repeat protein
MPPIDVESPTELLHGLKSANVAQRAKSARDLAKTGISAKFALPALIQATDDPEQAVREAAVQTIASIGAESVPLLIRFLGHSCKYVRRNAVWSLGKLGPDAVQAVPMLCLAVRDLDPRTAGGAIQALGMIGRVTAEAVTILAETMRGTNVVLCRLASKSLSQIGQPALATLITHLKHHDPFVRGEAAVALGWMGASAAAAVQPLSELLVGHVVMPSSSHKISHGGSGAVTPIAIAPPKTNATEEAMLVVVIQALGRIGSASKPAEFHLHNLCSDSREAINLAAKEAMRLIREGEIEARR